MHVRQMIGKRSLRVALPLAVCLVAASAVATASATQAAPSPKAKGPVFKEAKAFDVSKPLRELATSATRRSTGLLPGRGPDRPVGEGTASGNAASGYRLHASRWGAVATLTAAAIPAPLLSFEGLSNQDNFNLFGFRVNPPDPVGDVGPNHYVEMVNLAFAVYDKQGNVLLPATRIGALWDGFAVEDCTDPSGDPIVLYDQLADRWILTQFTTRDPIFYNCIAISQTGDPTGAYYRYAFSTGPNFPDYPKYGVWKDSYVITTREFGPTVEYGIGVYALDRNKLIEGDPSARMVGFFLDGNDPAILPLVGDGLLPADLDGNRKPRNDAKIPIVGTQDDGAGYGATFDALNIWELDVHWNAKAAADATLALATQLPVAPFDSIFPCRVVPGPPPPAPQPTSRDCLPQPGVAPNQYLDILSYRQRPTWRLAYRNFKDYEALVTAQSVEALPATAGMRWYEIRRTNGTYTLYQQGTHAPSDGVHRWMGSIAQDKNGNAALGYSVVNATTVFPGIRYTGRLASDPLGTMPLGEGTIVNGTGVQRTTNSRWGDYTSMNVDPIDDCTFWYVNEYYTAAGQASSLAGWQTRIAAFKLPGCS